MLKVNIFDPRSEEWQSSCAPVQRQMTAETGGVILVFEATGEEGARIISSLRYMVFENVGEWPGGVTARLLYQDGNQDFSMVYHLSYQIFSEHGLLADCYLAAAKMTGAVANSINKNDSEQRETAVSK